jgi:hypothetical protein
VLNLIISAIGGNLDESGLYVMRNLTTIIVCVAALTIGEKFKLNMPIKLILIYIVVISMLQSFLRLQGQIFEALPPARTLMLLRAMA